MVHRPAKDSAMPTRVLIEPWRRALLDGGVPSVGQLADGVKDALRGESVRMNCFAL